MPDRYWRNVGRKLERNRPTPDTVCSKCGKEFNWKHEHAFAKRKMSGLCGVCTEIAVTRKAPIRRGAGGRRTYSLDPGASTDLGEM